CRDLHQGAPHAITGVRIEADDQRQHQDHADSKEGSQALGVHRHVANVFGCGKKCQQGCGVVEFAPRKGESFSRGYFARAKTSVMSSGCSAAPIQSFTAAMASSDMRASG